jgi:hypothetical protein
MTPRHLLLISGPSGGGKSTFIRQLAEKTLAPEILALLPTHSGDWPLIEANNVLKRDLSEHDFEAKIRAGGCLVHYDIVFIHLRGIRRYEDDPALAILDGVNPLHIVFVRPNSEVLRKQFLDRQTRHRMTKSTASLLWSRFFRLPMRRLLSPLTGKPTKSTEDIYGDEKWLPACYSQWENFIHRVLVQHPDAKITIVEPAGEGQAFRLR